jgi:hypothetical protein
VTRIEKANGISEISLAMSANDTADSAYLDDIAALTTKDPRWCLRIPEELPLATEPHKFRAWCLFTLATNTRDAELCRRIPIPAETRDARQSLQATCAFQVNSPHPSTAVYGPEAPVDDEQAGRLITRLGYEIPHAKDLPKEQIDEAYHQFLQELARPHEADSTPGAVRGRVLKKLEQPGAADSAHAAARERLLDRVRHLPNAANTPSAFASSR